MPQNPNFIPWPFGTRERGIGRVVATGAREFRSARYHAEQLDGYGGCKKGELRKPVGKTPSMLFKVCQLWQVRESVTGGPSVNVFDRYPAKGRTLLGRPTDQTGACRTGYGLGLQRLTGETNCAYCGVSLIDTYHHWLLMSIDHVVPTGEARRVGIGPEFSEDAVNLVLCCAGCNGFGNRYRTTIEPRPIWTLDEFLSLRDFIFEDRFARIAEHRAVEIAAFESRPWERATTR